MLTHCSLGFSYTDLCPLGLSSNKPHLLPAGSAFAVNTLRLGRQVAHCLTSFRSLLKRQINLFQTASCLPTSPYPASCLCESPRDIVHIYRLIIIIIIIIIEFSTTVGAPGGWGLCVSSFLRIVSSTLVNTSGAIGLHISS